MSVRKRTWKNKNGELSTRFVVDYRDRDGKRRCESFKRKGDAVARWHEIEAQQKKGRHVPRSQSITVAKAGEILLEHVEEIEKLERTTLKQYEQHQRLHINPYLGHFKLADLTAPDIAQWQSDLAGAGVSEAMRRKVRVTFSRSS